MSFPISLVMDDKDFKKRNMAFRLVGIGWHIAFSLIAGALGGFWLDNHLDTAPIFSLLGVTLGLLVAMVGLYLLVRPLMKEENKTDKEND